MFTPFAGYEMPVHYGSIKAEHLWVRENAGLFDVSHMSNLWIEGENAAAAIAKTTPSDPTAVPDGKGKYTVFLRDDGSILDDTFYFKMGEKFFVIPNAGMNEEVANHLQAHGAQVTDCTRDWAILALQGPKARAILADASPSDAPKFHRIVSMDIAGVQCMVSGTGYTGEKGVEIYVPSDGAAAVWSHLMEIGGPLLRPIGLGARDTLRLEKGYCLAGHEFAGRRTPIEAGLEWSMNWDGDFLGKARLVEQKNSAHAKLTPLTMPKGVPREGYTVHDRSGPIGAITSGTLSPSLGRGIALAYIDREPQGELQVEVRSRMMPAELATLPFV